MFRRHVGRGAQQLTGHRHALKVDHLGDAEVGQLYHAISADHDVLGFHVPVEDAEPVGVTEGSADLDGDHAADLRVVHRMKHRGTLHIGMLCLALSIALPSSPLRAEGFDDAREVYKQAQGHYDEGRFEKAAELYMSAYRMSRSPVLLYNVALSHRRQFQAKGNFDHLVEASQALQRVS